MLVNLHGAPIELGNSDRSSGMDDESNNREMVNFGLEIPNADVGHANALHASVDVDINGAGVEDQTEQIGSASKYGTDEPRSRQNTLVFLLLRSTTYQKDLS